MESLTEDRRQTMAWYWNPTEQRDRHKEALGSGFETL